MAPAAKAIAKELAARNLTFTVVARSPEKTRALKAFTSSIIIADPLSPESLKGDCHNQQVVISAL